MVCLLEAAKGTSEGQVYHRALVWRCQQCLWTKSCLHAQG